MRVHIADLVLALSTLAACAVGADGGTAPPPDTTGQSIAVAQLAEVPGEATAIAPNGRIAGYVSAPLGAYHAAVWNGGVLTDLGTVGGGAHCYAWRVNDRGQVVGWGVTAAERRVAVRWDDGVPTILDPSVEDGYSTASAINASGNVVGLGQAASEPASSHAMLWRNDGVVTDLGELVGDLSWANAVDDAGRSVGAASRKGSGPGGSTYPTVWTLER